MLIRGESGTGKDLIARGDSPSLHRCGGPFVTINCAALPETLLESELFGHQKGSFTGAFKDKEGLFNVASGGTFFLDEVGNTSLSIQVKLLRVLEDKKIIPVGDTKPIDVDVRLIAATNADLEEDVKAGRFRADLFLSAQRDSDPHSAAARAARRYSACWWTISSPSSRSRGNAPRQADVRSSDETADVLPWPGNVRELENTIERAILLNRTECSSRRIFRRN